MMVKKNILPGLYLFFVIFCAAAISKAETTPSGKKNAILIIIDSLRFDHLGCYGYRFNTSPAIDAMAKESFVFENAFSQSCYTIASHASIFTSLYPKSHGTFDVSKDMLPRRVPTMAELFKNNGLATAWFSLLHHPHLDIDIGFGRGFDVTGELNERLDQREDIFNWIKNNKDHSFFLAMNARSVHDPYSPDPAYKNAFRRGRKGRAFASEEELEKSVYGSLRRDVLKNLTAKEIAQHRDLLSGGYTEFKARQLPLLLSRTKQLETINRKRADYFRHINIHNEQNLEYVRSQFDACILELDQKLIGPLIAFLKELGIYENTMIIITSDHGEEFGEHGGLGHEFKLYDELVRVPLIIKIPGYTDTGRIKQLAQSIDIVPTLCAYFGILAPGHVQGKDLFPLLLPGSRNNVHQFVYGENPKEVYIRSEDWKLIVPYDRNGQRYLFDEKSDPAEKNNLYDSELAAQARVLLEKKLEEQRYSLPLYQEGENNFFPEISPEIRERIKKTGYW
jgi:choline-sulfatase